MSAISVKDIINVDNPEEYKFHAARWNDVDQPLDVYARDRNEWVGWNTWGDSRNIYNRPYIFSLIDFYHETNVWLFGGIFKVIDRYNEDGYVRYKVEEMREYSSYVGRLKVKLEKPGRGKSFYLESWIDKMIVLEILKESYSGETFPGYENINHDFSKLVPIFRNENRGWKAALENVKGVYVIADKTNGKKYIGSAYGESGIWSRWMNYIDTRGHGWNEGLADVIKRNSDDYAESNFTISLLEYRSMKTDDRVIIERENYWKSVFLSRGEFGYNKN